jgi:hypothetical protein
MMREQQTLCKVKNSYTPRPSVMWAKGNCETMAPIVRRLWRQWFKSVVSSWNDVRYMEFFRPTGEIQEVRVRRDQGRAPCSAEAPLAWVLIVAHTRTR